MEAKKQTTIVLWEPVITVPGHYCMAQVIRPVYSINPGLLSTNGRAH